MLAAAAVLTLTIDLYSYTRIIAREDPAVPLSPSSVISLFRYVFVISTKQGFTGKKLENKFEQAGLVDWNNRE